MCLSDRCNLHKPIHTTSLLCSCYSDGIMLMTIMHTAKKMISVLYTYFCLSSLANSSMHILLPWTPDSRRICQAPPEIWQAAFQNCAPESASQPLLINAFRPLLAAARVTLASCTAAGHLCVLNRLEGTLDWKPHHQVANASKARWRIQDLMSPLSQFYCISLFPIVVVVHNRACTGKQALTRPQCCMHAVHPGQ